MEQNFQTSFIPKKPMIDERAVSPRPVGLFALLSLLVFFAMLVTTGALFVYKGILTKNIANMENNLSLAKNRFEPSKISQLQVLDKRLRASNEILSSHIAISPIFEALQAITMKTVRYTKFVYELNADASIAMVTVKMSGMAVGYRSVALQSDLFTKNKNLIDPIFSNLSLDEKGNVLFDLQFSVDPSFVDYRQMLKTESTEAINAIPANAVFPAGVVPPQLPQIPESFQPSTSVTN